MVNKATLIRNPAARKAPTLERLQDAITAVDGWEIEIIDTAAAGHATELALMAAAQNVDAVIACGGDGTVNEVANGLVGSGVPLAVVRGGTANIWSKEAGVAKTPAEALQLLLTGDRRAVDLGRVQKMDEDADANGGSRHFLLMASVGFDAGLVRDVSAAWKRRLGATAYAISGIRRLFGHRATQADIEIDGVVERTSLYWLLLGNTRSYAGVLDLTHRASAIDGLLDYCLLERGGPFRIAWLLPWALLRRHSGRAGVQYRTVKELEVRTAHLPVQVDGEYLTQTPVRIDVIPHALRVVVPADLDSPLFERPSADE